jgi:plastocyanin
MKFRFPALSIVVFVLLSLVLTSCGASGGNTSLNVDLTDFAFKPNTFTIPSGKEISVSVTNKGANVHEFVIMKKGSKVDPPFGDKDEGNIYWELDDVQTGTSKSGKVTLSDPGTYQVICGTPNHIEMGMVGSLMVQ